MKTKKSFNTLVLNKRTVSRLSAPELNESRGGTALVIVKTKDCVLVPIDNTIPITISEPDPEPWETDIIVQRIG